MGLTCEKEANEANGKKTNGIISEPGKLPAVIVIPTNEELTIARETLKILVSCQTTDLKYCWGLEFNPWYTFCIFRLYFKLIKLISE